MVLLTLVPVIRHFFLTKKCIRDSVFGAATFRQWNELPVNIRASGILPMFRKNVGHLFRISC